MEAVAGSIRLSLFNRLTVIRLFSSQSWVPFGSRRQGARPPATAMYVFPPPVTFPSRGVGELSIPKI
ncbi:hypothetical protein SETIT_4G166600v2 [Setaria italica]|uniref:Uncharacterized protein n=1 Tax=Setaria italica TaxID=4555 RepID=A0A368QV44_SETIT|nr:hypothetical protein SETIT_4G166600v2 [Setaria italica]